MTRPHSVESSEPNTIHPVLAKALNCVDVQLETELARYRREIAESGESRSDLVISSEEGGSSPTLPISTPAPPPATEQPPNNNPLNLQFPSEGSLVHQPQTQPPGEIPISEPPPSDYLESSEQLLRHLDSSRSHPQPQSSPKSAPESPPSFPERLLTPLGVGSMALLFGAIALLGAAILDPERLTTLRLPGIGDNRETVETITPRASEAESDAAATNSDEELDLDNLSNIQPRLQPRSQAPVNAPTTPTPPPSAVPPNYNIPGSSSDLTNALVSPLTPTPEASPAPSSEALVPQNIEPAPAPTTSDYYYVLADYSGPNSLQQAQAVVPDAYVRQFEVGDRIQMGAFLTQADANALANRLQNQGLPVSVYRP
ncbi:MAG: SPOR domain-containing protein [Spirulinaceae cyanobacterium]